jgi:DNA-directed RNA polymerase subunit M/transcription elongation factor TFIIS
MPDKFPIESLEDGKNELSPELSDELSNRQSNELSNGLSDELSNELSTGSSIDDVNRMTDLEKEIHDYRNDIEEFKDRGYNVSRMYDLLSRDITIIRQSMLQYMQDINKLKEIEKELDELETEGFERDIVSLRALLMNPDMLEEANSYYEGLKDRMGRRESVEMETRMHEVEGLFDGVVKEFSEITNKFRNEIEDIKVSIIDMETAPLSEYRTVKRMIFDLKDSMIHEKLAKEREDEKQSIIEELNDWRKKGFKVSEIENTIESDLKLTIEMFNDFLKKAKELLEYENELDKMKIKGFETEAEELRKNFRDTEKLFLVKNTMESLKRRIRLAGIQIKMDRMKSPELSKRSGPLQMNCPKCGGIVPIPSDERPLKVNCSSCHTEFHLKRVPTSESDGENEQPPAQGAVGSTGPGTPTGSTGSMPGSIPIPPLPGAEEVHTVSPIPSDSDTVGVTVTPITPAEEEKCPKCGAALIQGSVFCGLCGHRME